MLPRPPYRINRHMARIHLHPQRFRDQLLRTTWSRRNCTSTNQSATPRPRPRARRLSSSSGQANSGRSMRVAIGDRACPVRCNLLLCERSRGCRPRLPVLLLSSPSGSFLQPTLRRIRNRLSLHRCTRSMCNRQWANHRVQWHLIRASLNPSETGLGATPRQIFGAIEATLLQHGDHSSAIPPRSQARGR